MRFGAAQRAIGICNRLEAGKPGNAERLKFRLHFRATVLAMVQVDVVDVTALKPGWAWCSRPVAAAICLPNVAQEVCSVPCDESHRANFYTFFPRMEKSQ